MEGYCSTTLLGRFFSFLDRWFTGNHLCWPRTTKRPFYCLIMYMFQFHNETNFDKISFCNTTVAGSMIGVNCGAALWNMKLFRISRTQLFSSVKNAHGGDLSSMQWIVPGTYTGTPSLFSWQAIIFRDISYENGSLSFALTLEQKNTKNDSTGLLWPQFYCKKIEMIKKGIISGQDVRLHSSPANPPVRFSRQYRYQPTVFATSQLGTKGFRNASGGRTPTGIGSKYSGCPTLD